MIRNVSELQYRDITPLYGARFMRTAIVMGEVFLVQA